MSRSLLLPAVAALVAVLGACNGPAPEASSALERDLAEVRASTVDLAPRGAERTAERTMVVSAEEQTGAAQRVVAPTRSSSARRTARPQPRAVRARSAPAAVATPAPRPDAADAADADEVVSAPPPQGPSAEKAPVVSGPLRRAPAPDATPEPPGGWRSTSDVIRNAPFPIKP